MPYHRTSDGTRLHYEVAGRTSPGRPTFILVHGLCSHLGHWAPLRDALVDRGRVIALDLRGHGRSDAPPSGYTMRGLGDDVAGLIDARGGGSPVVMVGHSMGSTVSLTLATRHARLVRAVISVDGSLDRFTTAKALPGDRTYRAFVDLEHPAGVTALYRLFFPDPRDADLAARVIEEAARTPRHAAIASLRATLLADVPAIARRLRQPLLYIGASHRNRSEAALRALVPHGEFGQVVQAGHFAHLEAPDQVIAMISRFLSRLEDA